MNGTRLYKLRIRPKGSGRVLDALAGSRVGRDKTQEWVTSLFCLCLAQEWAGRLLPCDDGEKFRNDRHAMIDIGVASHMHTGMWHTAGGYVV